jgi:hypothetical protein
VAEPVADRLRVLEQARRAAAEFASGRDGTLLAPPEIVDELGAWVGQLERKHRKLDEEGWLIGLLTLVCLARQQSAAPEAMEGGQRASARSPS